MKTITLRTLLTALCLCGFLSHWLDKTDGPKLTQSNASISEKQATWSRFLGYDPSDHTSELSGLTHDSSLLFVRQSKRIIALDAKNGRPRWQQTLVHTINNCTTFHAESIFITTAEPRLFAIKPSTGKPLWSYKLPHTVIAKAAVNQDQVIVKTIQNEVLAFNIKNGKLLWRYQQALPTLTMLHTSSAPQLAGNQCIVGFPNGQVVALDATRGVLLWEHTVKQAESKADLNQLVDIASDPVIDRKNDAVYVSAYHGMLQRLSLATGKVEWQRPFSGYLPLALGKHLYAVDENYVVYAFNVSDGSMQWQQNTFKDYQHLFHHYYLAGSVLIHQGKQLMLSDYAGNLYLLNAEDGAIVGRHTFKVASPVLNTPLVKNDVVYAMNRRSQVAAWKIALAQPKIDPIV